MDSSGVQECRVGHPPDGEYNASQNALCAGRSCADCYVCSFSDLPVSLRAEGRAPAWNGVLLGCLVGHLARDAWQDWN